MSEAEQQKKIDEENAMQPEPKLLEGVEGLKSYLRKAKTQGELTPTDYQNPFTRQPFENEVAVLDYWLDLLDSMPPEKDLGPKPK
jgi:hypothetical protein